MSDIYQKVLRFESIRNNLRMDIIDLDTAIEDLRKQLPKCAICNRHVGEPCDITDEPSTWDSFCDNFRLS